jgi:hypothetical protein
MLGSELIFIPDKATVIYSVRSRAYLTYTKEVEHVLGYDVYAQGWQRRRDLMADLATIIPAGKNVLLISLFGKEKDIQISTEEIYFFGA